MRTRDNRPLPVILLFGPTAVGKTELLYSLDPRRIEVINADSMQVYRYMDIGTAKPDPDLQSLIPHHLIDILDPGEQYNAGLFVEYADKIVPEIISRGKIPLLTGGTAFYFKNFMYGLPETPRVTEEVRASVTQDLAHRGAEQLHSELQHIDPAAYNRISVNDEYRISRAHEVYRQTGRALSDFAVGNKLREQYDFHIFGLERPRDELYRRINERVVGMFREGLVKEIAELIARGYSLSDPGMRAIGYREFFIMRSEGCPTMQDTMEMIQQASRRYAKRQITFFTKLPDVCWIDPSETEGVTELLDSFFPLRPE